jgi:hypothetical protein
MTQEDKPPTPSGRSRNDFRRKKEPEEKKEPKKEETEETQKSTSAIPNNDSNLTAPPSKTERANRIVREIVDCKEFWIFLTGLALGYILGRF